MGDLTKKGRGDGGFREAVDDDFYRSQEIG